MSWIYTASCHCYTNIYQNRADPRSVAGKTSGTLLGVGIKQYFPRMKDHLLATLTTENGPADNFSHAFMLIRLSRRRLENSAYYFP